MAVGGARPSSKLVNEFDFKLFPAPATFLVCITHRICKSAIAVKNCEGRKGACVPSHKSTPEGRDDSSVVPWATWDSACTDGCWGFCSMGSSSSSTVQQIPGEWWGGAAGMQRKSEISSDGLRVDMCCKETSMPFESSSRLKLTAWTRLWKLCFILFCVTQRCFFFPPCTNNL